jgi:low affinity Fe/Cu permease
VHIEHQFNRLASKTSQIAGRPIASIIAMLIVICWAASGPIFSFSETWQLVINTGTTIITFLMVFLIQNSQNRDGLAIQAKLDELIVANEAARNELAGIEQKDETEIQRVRK